MAVKETQRSKGMFYNDGREEALRDAVMEHGSAKLQGNPAAVLAAIEEAATERRMMTFKGDKLVIARQTLEAMVPKPKVIVELGTYVGCSAVAWGAMLQELWKDSPEDLRECRVFTCELDSKFGDIAAGFVELAGLEGIVKVCAGKMAGETIRELASEATLKQIDVLFFDHWEDSYLPDLQLAEELKLLRKSSILIADNVDMPGAPLYLDYIQKGGSGKEGSYRFETRSVETKSRPPLVEITKIVAAPNDY